MDIVTNSDHFPIILQFFNSTLKDCQLNYEINNKLKWKNNRSASFINLMFYSNNVAHLSTDVNDLNLNLL